MRTIIVAADAGLAHLAPREGALDVACNAPADVATDAAAPGLGGDSTRIERTVHACAVSRFAVVTTCCNIAAPVCS